MIIGITPARGGSKGVVRKNIKPIAEKPLIAWTIEQALKSSLIDRYMVSTEDPEIRQVAQRYGAEVMDRPHSLSQDHVPTIDVLKYVVDKIDCTTVVLLQATSPVRDEGMIDSCITRFLKKGVDSLATGFMCTFKPYGTCHKPRQEIDGFFYDDGNLYVIKSDIIAKGDRYGKKIEYVYLDREQNVEIDDEFDFFIAEQTLLRRQKRG